MSLSSQLQALGAANINARQLAQNATKHRDSYLFSHRQAATLSNDDIFNLAQNGLAALLQLDPRLSNFEDDLFGDGSKQTDRTLLTKEENEKLDIVLSSCLRTLGPNVLVRPCGQVLEWLIRRYRSLHTF